MWLIKERITNNQVHSTTTITNFIFLYNYTQFNYNYLIIILHQNFQTEK